MAQNKVILDLPRRISRLGILTAIEPCHLLANPSCWRAPSTHSLHFQPICTGGDGIGIKLGGGQLTGVLFHNRCIPCGVTEENALICASRVGASGTRSAGPRQAVQAPPPCSLTLHIHSTSIREKPTKLYQPSLLAHPCRLSVMIQ